MPAQSNIVSRLFLSFGIYWLLFCLLTQYKKTRGRRHAEREPDRLRGDWFVRAAHGAGRSLRDALQPKRGGILPRWEPRALAGRRTELFHVGVQRVDFYRGGRSCVSRGDCGHRPVRRQRSEFSARIFCLRRAMATEPYHDRDGVSVRALQLDHSSDILVDHDPVSAFHQRQHAVRAQPVRFVGVRISGHLDDSRRRGHHHFLLRDWRAVGGRGHGFSAGLHPDAVLPGAGDHITGSRRR